MCCTLDIGVYKMDGLTDWDAKSTNKNLEFYINYKYLNIKIMNSFRHLVCPVSLYSISAKI